VAALEKSFKPHPNMVKLYSYYLLILMTPIVVGGFIAIWLVYMFDPAFTYVPAAAVFIPLAVIVGFISYWIPRYYRSISYQLTSDEVVVERGVWWRFKHTVPYARVMSVDVAQGPISRMLGIATVDVYTAGYTGVAGGSGGPGSRRAEASIIHVSNFADLRESVLSVVRGRPLFAAPVSDVSAEMLSELRKIRELLEKK